MIRLLKRKSIIKPTVYYGPKENGHVGLMDPLVSLTKSMKDLLVDDSFLDCVGTREFMKGAWVIKSPYPIAITESGRVFNMQNNQQVGGIVGDKTKYAQYLAGHVTFFANDTVNMTAYPPFLHKPEVQGIAGTYDINKWLRPLSYAHNVGYGREVQIDRGEPVCYVKFDRPVKLKKVTFPASLDGVFEIALHYKDHVEHTSLKDLYRMFTSGNLSKVVVRKLEEYNK